MGNVFTMGAHMGSGFYEICAPNRMLDKFNLREETQNGVEGLILSLDGSNFEKTLNYDISEKGSVLNLHFANTENSSNDIKINDYNASWISGGYDDYCVLMASPTIVKRGQIHNVDSSLIISYCGVNTPATLRLNYSSAEGESHSIILNITP